MAHIKDNEVLRQFNQRMRTLREDGVFTTQKRSVAGGARYLIISYGGTGADALFQIRRTLKKTLPPEDFKKYIRFLAIDTDQATMNQTERVELPDGTTRVEVRDALDQSEFCLLDGAVARGALKPLDKEVEKWINPDLPHMIHASNNYLDGNGASATRQIGRLTLFPTEVCTKLQAMVSAQATELLLENLDPLYVMIVTGISGGTGSGVVIDATYLIRDAVQKVMGDRAEQAEAKFSGFILLPPTGERSANAEIVRKGNRNGYAALKEINHFMTLADRRDYYSQTYGNVTVGSGKNIFDVCYLMDGYQMGMLKANPREFANTVLADCIVDMISSQPTDEEGGATPRGANSLISDVGPFIMGMLSDKKKEYAPRDVDYLYCVLGHGDVPIPVDEIKTYVARQIFARMYKSLRDGEDVDKRDAKKFVSTVKGAGQNWKSVTNKELNGYFTDPEYGPFFVINLLYEAIPIVKEMQGKLFADNDRLKEIEKYFYALNNTYFSVFTEVLESLKDILDDQYDMVCQGTYSKNIRGGSEYSFRPIDLAAGDEASSVIRTYLSDLVTNSRVNKLTEELLETIIANRDAWARLDRGSTPNGPAFDAPAQLRIFWEREITKIVNATIEDLLIKLYSGDKNAKYDKDDPQSEQLLEKAAQNIYAYMFGAGGKSLPTASVDNKGLNISHFNGHNYMMVPTAAPNLLAALRKIAAGKKNPDVQVYGSTSTDCISCYCQYTNLPAFKFFWTKRAEADYESMIGTVGLHMAETSGTNNWRELPNLMPMSTWQLLDHYDNPRERKLAERAQELFTESKALGLTVGEPAIGVAMLQYSLKRLTGALLPSEQLLKDFDVRDVEVADEDTIRDRERIKKEIEDQAMAAAKKLFASVDSWLGVDNIVAELEGLDAEKRKALDVTEIFELKELRSVSAVLDVPNMPSDWSEYIAACYLRKMPDLMASMRGTLMVMHYLEDMVRASQNEVDQIVDFAKFVVADMFYFDEDYQQWNYSDGSREYMLFAQEIDDEVQENSAYFFMFEAYKDKATEVKDALTPEYEELSGVHDDRPVQVEKRRALNAKAKVLYQAVQKKLTIDRKNPDKMTQLGSTDFARAAKAKGYDPEAIQAMYQKLADTIRANFNIR